MVLEKIDGTLIELGWLHRKWIKKKKEFCSRIVLKLSGTLSSV